MMVRWSGEVQVSGMSGERQISIWAWHWWTWNLSDLSLWHQLGFRRCYTKTVKEVISYTSGISLLSPPLHHYPVSKCHTGGRLGTSGVVTSLVTCEDGRSPIINLPLALFTPSHLLWDSHYNDFSLLKSMLSDHPRDRHDSIYYSHSNVTNHRKLCQSRAVRSGIMSTWNIISGSEISKQTNM